jgi:hypothetical protein
MKTAISSSESTSPPGIGGLICVDVGCSIVGVGVLDDPSVKFDLDGQISAHCTELPPVGGRDVEDAIPYRVHEPGGIRMDIIKRIEHMEALYDRALETGEIPSELTDYYIGGQWLSDYMADERGELPPGLKRGVLAEDTVYDLFTQNRALLEELRSLLPSKEEET